MIAVRELTLTTVRTAEDIADVTRLTWAFFDYIVTRYPAKKAMIDNYIALQDVAGKLRDFATYFNPPAGECLLARLDGTAAGIVMLRPEGPGLCELNRMYVTPEERGNGVARALCLRLMAEARMLGYSEMRLDAVDETVEAVPLYRKLGFEQDWDPPEWVKMDPDIVSLRQRL
ncbi:GNAT family N-acetyltransferase [Algicella marina]|uniref:GNAT family N-acetyltransferase n=1 Tax=Algicella marina TaxID=2683284 RepID=A0A6P1T501_9RHOB|nr:GNAT family N-acetyltransferase [Algicella marina]QHQ36825.1 GNAT family N-acetyltransferase [Algicella marina]